MAMFYREPEATFPLRFNACPFTQLGDTVFATLDSNRIQVMPCFKGTVSLSMLVVNSANVF
jgi:hypothetical protein